MDKGWTKLNESIQKKLGSNLFEFKLETDKFARFVIYSHQKKAYIRIICDLNWYINAKQSELNNSKIFTNLLNLYNTKSQSDTKKLISKSASKSDFEVDIKGPFSWT